MAPPRRLGTRTAAIVTCLGIIVASRGGGGGGIGNSASGCNSFPSFGHSSTGKEQLLLSSSPPSPSSKFTKMISGLRGGRAQKRSLTRPFQYVEVVIMVTMMGMESILQPKEQYLQPEDLEEDPLSWMDNVGGNKAVDTGRTAKFAPGYELEKGEELNLDEYGDDEVGLGPAATGFYPEVDTDSEERKLRKQMRRGQIPINTTVDELYLPKWECPSCGRDRNYRVQCTNCSLNLYRAVVDLLESRLEPTEVLKILKEELHEKGTAEEEEKDREERTKKFSKMERGRILQDDYLRVGEEVMAWNDALNDHLFGFVGKINGDGTYSIFFNLLEKMMAGAYPAASEDLVSSFFRERVRREDIVPLEECKAFLGMEDHHDDPNQSSKNMTLEEFLKQRKAEELRYNADTGEVEGLPQGVKDYLARKKRRNDYIENMGMEKKFLHEEDEFLEEDMSLRRYREEVIQEEKELALSQRPDMAGPDPGFEAAEGIFNKITKRLDDDEIEQREFEAEDQQKFPPGKGDDALPGIVPGDEEGAEASDDYNATMNIRDDDNAPLSIFERLTHRPSQGGKTSHSGVNEDAVHKSPGPEELEAFISKLPEDEDDGDDDLGEDPDVPTAEERKLIEYITVMGTVVPKRPIKEQLAKIRAGRKEEALQKRNEMLKRWNDYDPFTKKEKAKSKALRLQLKANMMHLPQAEGVQHIRELPEENSDDEMDYLMVELNLTPDTKAGLDFSWGVTKVHRVPGQDNIKEGDIIIGVGNPPQTLLGRSYVQQLDLWKKLVADRYDLFMGRRPQVEIKRKKSFAEAMQKNMDPLHDLREQRRQRLDNVRRQQQRRGGGGDIAKREAEGRGEDGITTSAVPSATTMMMRMRGGGGGGERGKKAIDGSPSASSATTLPQQEHNLRSPICCVMGHVDTGKTKLLDRMRRTRIQDHEAGGITQQIGATFFPLEVLNSRTKTLYQALNQTQPSKIPGLLVIDTPGHESFTNLRVRGSNLCDIAVLVIDIMHGLEPQTIESINLLKAKKTPFIIALNKIDRCYKWKSVEDAPVRESMALQDEETSHELQSRIDETISALTCEAGLNTALYFKNKDFRKYISIVPISAITGEGVCDLMMLLMQLTQKYQARRIGLKSQLECSILDVKKSEGLGSTIDVILVNGKLAKGDTICICGLGGPILTPIRVLMLPKPLRESRVHNDYQEKEVIYASAGIRIAAAGLEDAVAGTTLLVVNKDNEEEIEDAKRTVQSELKSILNKVNKKSEGVCVHASTLGSLEALLSFFNSSNVPVSTANIGPIGKKDVIKANSLFSKYKEPHKRVILGFDVKVTPDALSLDQPYYSMLKLSRYGVLRNKLRAVIFRSFLAISSTTFWTIGEQKQINSKHKLLKMMKSLHIFRKHVEDFKELQRKKVEQDVVFPAVVDILPNCVFCKKSPLLMGVLVVELYSVTAIEYDVNNLPQGVLKVGTPLVALKSLTEHVLIGKVTGIEMDHKEKQEAKKGQEVCIRVEQHANDRSLLYGRHFDHKNQLVSKVTQRSLDALQVA
eukprot:jgi/Bigna1/75334/fgenesh1_pg.34_\